MLFIKKGFGGVQSLSSAPNLDTSRKDIIKITFQDARSAQAFSQYAGGARREDNVVILGPARAPEVFKNLRVPVHGRRNPRPMYQAICYETKQARLSARRQPQAPATTTPRSTRLFFQQLQRATVSQFGSQAPSVIQGVNAYDINALDPDPNGKFGQARRAVHAHIDHMQVGLQSPPCFVTYMRNVFRDEDDVKKTLWTNDNAHNAAQHAQHWRHKTKARAVSSEVLCYMDGQGRRFPHPVSCVLTTGCAPNFMESSPKDLRYYTYASGALDTAKYQRTMEHCIEHWLAAQQQLGVNVVVLPLVGCGVYLKQLSGPDKYQAKECFSDALKNVLSRNSFDFTEVVLAIPNEGQYAAMNHRDYQQAHRLFSQYHGKTPLTLVNGDVLGIVNAVAGRGLQPGLINPGSDRTMGGHFEHYVGTNLPKKATSPLEELIFNATNALYCQTCDYNEANMQYIPFDRSNTLTIENGPLPGIF